MLETWQLQQADFVIFATIGGVDVKVRRVDAQNGRGIPQ
jgi:hypothetical protein